jgi:hypothetical protein
MHSARYPWVVHSARRIPITRFLMDGEAVCRDGDVAISPVMAAPT